MENHGPGHQSTSSDFLSFEDGTTDKDVESYLDEKMSVYDWPITRFWQIKLPPKDLIGKRIRNITSRIAELKKEKSELLKAKTCDTVFSEKGEDAEVGNALGNTVRHSLLKELHERGVVVDNTTVGKWWYGGKTSYLPAEEKPARKIRKKVLEAAKVCEKYSKCKEL